MLNVDVDLIKECVTMEVNGTMEMGCLRKIWSYCVEKNMMFWPAHMLRSGVSEVKQEAQLPQRNSVSAVHVYLGWLTDRAMHRTPQNRRGCTISDIQTL